MYTQAVRRCVNVRFISRTHKIARNVTQAQRNAIHALKTKHNIVIKPTDKEGAIIIQNRTDYYKEAEASLKRLHGNINKFNPTISLTMDYASESVSFLDTCITVKDGHLTSTVLIVFTDRVQFIVQHFPGAVKLLHILCSLQHVVDDGEHHAMPISSPPIYTFKQLFNPKQTIIPSKLPSLQENSGHDTTQPCQSNLHKTCQIINMDTNIAHGNTIHHVH
eukprot:g40121.t1